MTIEQIENELMNLSASDRLRLARWLLDTLINRNAEKQSDENPLLHIAGRFSGGPGDTAERAEDILSTEVNSTYGMGVR